MGRNLAWLALLLFAHPAAAQPAGTCDASDESPLAAFVADVASLEDPLPPCAGPLFRAAYEASRSVARRGTVREDLYLTSANRADPDALVTGSEIFPAIASLIEGAEHEVAMQFYDWERSDPSREIVAGIARLAERRARVAPDGPPVVVRILVDALAVEDPGMESSFARRLPAVTREIEALGLDPRHVKVEVAGYLHRALGSLHSKTVVVDGSRAIVTGANPQDQHDYAAPWHDAGFRFEGDVGAALRDDIASAWRKSMRWRCGGVRWGPSTCLEKTEAMPPLAPAPITDACSPMLVTTRRADGNPFRNRTNDTQAQTFLALVRNAKERVRIHTPNLNDDAIVGALVDAAARGIAVEIAMTKGFNERLENLPGQGGGNEKVYRRMIERLRARGVEDPCSVLRVRWVSKDGTTPVVGNGPGASHTKYFSADGEVAVVGSANMDTQSWNHSRETNVLVGDRDVVAAWDREVFEESYGRAVDACR